MLGVGVGRPRWWFGGAAALVLAPDEVRTQVSAAVSEVLRSAADD